MSSKSDKSDDKVAIVAQLNPRQARVVRSGVSISQFDRLLYEIPKGQIEIELNESKLRGQIVFSDERSARDIEVALYDIDSEEKTSATYTNNIGYFSFRQLDSGKYRLNFLIGNSQTIIIPEIELESDDEELPF